MGCGCAENSGGCGCGCGKPVGAESMAGTHGRIGVKPGRLPVGAQSTSQPSEVERAAPGLSPSPRVTGREPPIGTRSAVPVPEGFVGGGVHHLPRALVVQRLFGEAGELVQRKALALLEQVPDASVRRVQDELAATPSAFRLSRLGSIVARNPSAVPPDPTVAVSEVAVRRAHVPIPWTPAAQGAVCLVNGFDPRWGQPPDSYLEIPLQFDAARGWYDFDRLDALRRATKTAFGQPTWDRFEFARLADAYDHGSVLQPFRRALGSPWEHRFMLRVDRGATCQSTQAERGLA